MTVEKRGDMKEKCKEETGEKTCQETGKMTEYMYKVILNSTHHKRSNAFVSFFLKVIELTAWLQAQKVALLQKLL